MNVRTKTNGWPSDGANYPEKSSHQKATKSKIKIDTSFIISPFHQLLVLLLFDLLWGTLSKFAHLSATCCAKDWSVAILYILLIYHSLKRDERRKKRFSVRVIAPISLPPFFSVHLIPAPSTAYHEPHIPRMISRDRCDYTHHMYTSDNGSASPPPPPPEHNKQNHCNRRLSVSCREEEEEEHLLAPPAPLKRGGFYPAKHYKFRNYSPIDVRRASELRYNRPERHIRPGQRHDELKASIKHRAGGEISCPKWNIHMVLVENEN